MIININIIPHKHLVIFLIRVFQICIYYIMKLVVEQQMKDESFSIIKKQYQMVKQSIFSLKTLQLPLDKVENEQRKCSILIQQMEDDNNYQNIEEVSKIQDKYRQIKRTMTQFKGPSSQLQKQLKKIYNGPNDNKLERPQKPKLQQFSSIHPSDVTISNRNNTLDNFFKKKQQQLSSKSSSFKRVLNDKDIQSANDDISNKSISKFSRFSKSSIKRKHQQKQSQLKGIIQQHKKVVNKLQSKIKSQEQLNEFEKNLLKQQKNRYVSKIEEMESQIEQLYRDNYRLREIQKEKEKSKIMESFNMTRENVSKEEVAYEPYVIKTRTNDLNKINQKNLQKSKEKLEKGKEDYLGNKLEKEKIITAQEFFNKKPNYLGLYEDKFASKREESKDIPNEFILKDLLGQSFEDNHKKKLIQHEAKLSNGANLLKNNANTNYEKSLNQQQNYLKQNSFKFDNSRNQSNGSINQNRHFDTFQMANTLSFVNDSAIGQSRQMIKMNSTTCTRNKVAFFKNSLVIIRESELEVAFKKSDLNVGLNQIRIIFYINNKSQRKTKVHLNYQYQQQYYQIQVKQKLSFLNPNSQGREQILVTLISKVDLNGVTDLHVEIDDKIYDLWLPVNFIKFKQVKNYHMINNQVQMNVIPDRQFASFESMKEITPVVYGGKDKFIEWAYLYGESKFGNFTIKLTWKDKQLTIECTEKWIDFIGFIFHFFK